MTIAKRIKAMIDECKADYGWTTSELAKALKRHGISYEEFARLMDRFPTYGPNNDDGSLQNDKQKAKTMAKLKRLMETCH